MSPHARSGHPYHTMFGICCFLASTISEMFRNYFASLPRAKSYSLEKGGGALSSLRSRIIEGRASMHLSFILHISWQPWWRHLPELSWWENKKTWQCWRKAKVKQAPSLDWMSRLFWLLGQQDHLNHFPWNRAGLKNQILEIEWMWGK